MLCPVCDSEMIIQELQQVEVDHCLNCHGIWLDQGELEILLEQDAERGISGTPARDTGEAPRKCPMCHRTMDKQLINEQHKAVVIDKCPKNHGIWFDNGELVQLLQSSENQQSKLTRLLIEMFGKAQ
ncbi:MAG: zf-TFIIB domain-containing protein [Bacteroidales bacterium]